MEFLKKCHDADIHTAIETSLFVSFESVEKVLPYVDLIFADLKHHYPIQHKEYTGVPNELIIDNLGKISDLNDNIIIRIPLIPGVNDSEADMNEFAKIINRLGQGIKAVELLKYNHMAQSKYNALGIDYTSFGDMAQDVEKISSLAEVMSKMLKINVC